MIPNNEFEPNALLSKLGFQPVPPSMLGGSGHFVQFYEKDDSLIDSVAVFLETGLRANQSVLVIATPAHRAALLRRFRGDGAPMVNYIALDAADTLSKFMVDDWPHETLFREAMEGIVQRAIARGNGLRAFGEMVSLLWAEGNGKAAIRLEELWNDLIRSHPFALFCAYPMEDFRNSANLETFLRICREHTHIVSEPGANPSRP